jgi:hypothetical protein
MGGAPLNGGKEVPISVKEPQPNAGPNDLQPDLEHRILGLEKTLVEINKTLTVLQQQEPRSTGTVTKLAQDYPVRFSQALGVLINAALFAAYTAFFGTKPDAEVALSIGVVVQYASAWIAGRYVESTVGRSTESDQPQGLSGYQPGSLQTPR